MIREMDGSHFEADPEATREFNRDREYDGFILRENFFAQLYKFPVLKEALARFGADINKPESVAWLVEEKEKNNIVYFHVPYVICGKILEHERFIEVDDVLHFEIHAEKPPSYMHLEDEENKFILYVYGFGLPWVMDAPYPVEMYERPKIYDLTEESEET